ncbi:hypothetical protein HF577_23590 [Pseudonocardia xinjiangensis]|uniref:ANTAR domain-containing protein n=1 Tax=Pseudonocardia xinjiangensis TaxID=75289 RepID=A0ABX1RKP3_9PSEU|nr:hypothetical protein [Pseudonocardia xinjiangensis]NMH80059.1 hypothetical protein [Pseudonocardia xinjiangensis]
MMDDGGWLELLLTEAPGAEFAAHERQLAQETGSTERAASEAVAALRIRTLLEQRTQRARELATLNEVAAHLTATGQRDQLGLIDDIVVHARRVLGVDMAYLCLMEANRRLRIHAVSGALTPHMLGMSIAAEAARPYSVSRCSAATRYSGCCSCSSGDRAGSPGKTSMPSHHIALNRSLMEPPHSCAGTSRH